MPAATVASIASAIAALASSWIAWRLYRTQRSRVVAGSADPVIAVSTHSQTTPMQTDWIQHRVMVMNAGGVDAVVMAAGFLPVGRSDGVVIAAFPGGLHQGGFLNVSGPALPHTLGAHGVALWTFTDLDVNSPDVYGRAAALIPYADVLRNTRARRGKWSPRYVDQLTTQRITGRSITVEPLKFPRAAPPSSQGLQAQLPHAEP
jgi:hypothetical protein